MFSFCMNNEYFKKLNICLNIYGKDWINKVWKEFACLV